MQLQHTALFRQQCYIDGQWVDTASRKTISVVNPADGKEIGTVPSLGAEDVRHAIATADRALRSWRNRTAVDRSNLIRRWFDLCMANQEDLATILTMEQGKPLAESRGEIAYGSGFLQWFSEEARRAYGDVIPSASPDRRIMVIKPASATPYSALALAVLAEEAGIPAGVVNVVTGASGTVGGGAHGQPHHTQGFLHGLDRSR